MDGLLNTNSEDVLEACIRGARLAIQDPSVSESAKLTYAALVQFKAISSDKPSPTLSTRLKGAVVRTGAYYFGPMFVLDKGTSIPTPKIIDELTCKGFHVESFRHMNNAQLNLFFITLKCRGLVTDRHFMGYVRYGV